MAQNPKVVIGVVGLGYVGLPLAVEFGKKHRTIGYDLLAKKVASFQNCIDPTGEISCEDFRAAVHVEFTTDPKPLKFADFLIVAVPTPVDEARIPDLSHLVGASITVGQHMKAGATVIYESTVYPGATEEVCVPLLERYSGLKWGKDFQVGYSPERINPGDKERTLKKIIKIVSGDSQNSTEKIAALYSEIIDAGVYKASSIKVAEAAKVIENTQRDLNIALMNELAIIFDMVGIDTGEVLQAARTKWNFINFKPGLVGGHCIGVDPYYLTHKAEMLGYRPEVILAGRRINDSIGKLIGEKTVKLMAKSGNFIAGARVNILGLTFKENCSDLRNSKVPDIVRELESYGITVNVHDPRASEEEALNEHGILLVKWTDLPVADALIIAVAHDEYITLGADLIHSARSSSWIIDVKSVLDKEIVISKGYKLWRL